MVVPSHICLAALMPHVCFDFFFFGRGSSEAAVWVSGTRKDSVDFGAARLPAQMKLFLSSLACNLTIIHLMVESPKVGTVCELDQKDCQQHSMA